MTPEQPTGDQPHKCMYTGYIADCIHPTSEHTEKFRERCIVYIAYKHGVVSGLEECTYTADGELRIDEEEYAALMEKCERCKGTGGIGHDT